MNDQEMRDMLIEYMGNGFLENISALLKQDGTLCRFIADMLGTDNIRVRLGATALVEELVAEHRREVLQAVPGIIALLKHDNPTIRGDAAAVLGIIKDGSALAALRSCLHDSNPAVRELAGEALAEIEG